MGIHAANNGLPNHRGKLTISLDRMALVRFNYSWAACIVGLNSPLSKVVFSSSLHQLSSPHWRLNAGKQTLRVQIVEKSNGKKYPDYGFDVLSTGNSR